MRPSLQLLARNVQIIGDLFPWDPENVISRPLHLSCKRARYLLELESHPISNLILDFSSVL